MGHRLAAAGPQEGGLLGRGRHADDRLTAPGTRRSRSTVRGGQHATIVSSRAPRRCSPEPCPWRTRRGGGVTAPGGGSAAAFTAAVASLRSSQEQVCAVRPELTFEDVPAPRTLAPFAIAVAATAKVGGMEAASGRFVLLYDPDGQRGWV